MFRKAFSRAALAGALAFGMSQPALGHGESEPGPHGGEIRMPGAFHVEVKIVDNGNAVKIYLLDMQFENPRIENSSVDARISNGEQVRDLDCNRVSAIKGFRCPLPDGTGTTSGRLIVEASRDGMPANPAEYELPLASRE